MQLDSLKASPHTASSIEEAYAYCERITRGHYENFPVGSLMIPKELRRHVYAIYAYSRAADDMADEGAIPAEDRILLLDDWERQLKEAYAGNADHPVFIALANTVRERGIPMEPLRDLLRAFRLDARNQGFETTTDLLFYCFHSAMPVGRLILHLFGFHTPERQALSDKICTALQLANFWQDISVDVPRGRINLPRESITYFEYSIEELRAGVFNDRFREVMAYYVDLAMNRFQEGYPLLKSIPDRRLRTELTLTFLGGVRILHKIKALDYNVLATRPTLTLRDKLWIISKVGVT